MVAVVSSLPPGPAVRSLPREEAEALAERPRTDRSERVLLREESMRTDERVRRGEERRERALPRGTARRMMKTGSEGWMSSG